MRSNEAIQLKLQMLNLYFIYEVETCVSINDIEWLSSFVIHTISSGKKKEKTVGIKTGAYWKCTNAIKLQFVDWSHELKWLWFSFTTVQVP